MPSFDKRASTALINGLFQICSQWTRSLSYLAASNTTAIATLGALHLESTTTRTRVARELHVCVLLTRVSNNELASTYFPLASSKSARTSHSLVKLHMICTVPTWGT